MAKKAVQSSPAKKEPKSPATKAGSEKAAATMGPKLSTTRPAARKIITSETTQDSVTRAVRFNSRGKMQDGSPHPIDIHVGSRVRLRRSIVKMSQQELARAVGITFQQVQKYERGTNRISISRMYEMAEALGVPATFFLEDMPEQFVGASKNQGFAEEAQAMFDADPLNKRETRSLIRAYYQITDPKLRKQLLDLAKTLAQSGDKDE